MKTFWTNLSTANPAVTVIVTAADADGTIIAVGDDRLLRDRDARDRIENLDGGFVTPGFWDSHLHLLEYGRSFRRLQFEASDSRRQVLDKVRRKAVAMPAQEWLIGAGWNRAAFEAEPDLKALDQAAPQHPALLISLDHHTVWINRRALERLGLAGSMGQEVLVSGILREAEAFRAQEEAMRQDNTHVEDDLTRAIREANKLGLVGVTTMESRAGFMALQDLASSERTLRAGVFLREECGQALLNTGIRAGFGDGWLRLMGVKLFMDGALGSGTAWMKRPYEGDLSQVGMMTLAPETLKEWVERLDEQSLLAAVHAIGDRAVHEAASAMSVGARGYKNRIEHAQLLDDEDLARVRKGGMALSMQPVHLLFDRPIADRQWGERSRSAFRFRDIVNAGIPLLFGSDAPIANPDPAMGMWAAVHRGLPGDEPWYSEQRITPEQAIDAYTRAPAAADARPSGQLWPGFWGDLTIWQVDPRMALIHKEFDRLRVAGTVVAGRRVV